MFNVKRIEDIRNKIQVSTLLSDHEKSDWLNLLELMNDKQLGELEEILGATNSVSAAAAALQQPLPQQPAAIQQKPVPGVDPKLPPLSHIANMPVKPMAPQAKVAIDKLSPKLPTQRPATPTGAPATPAPVLKPVSGATPPAKTQTPDPQPVPLTRSYEKLELRDISEIQKFSPMTLREFDLQSIVDAIRSSISQHGYYKVLQLLEASPLYENYIKTGKAMLGHQQSKDSGPNSILTQGEFEFITDLLRHMRFNAW